ncbi:hypothetical protein [Mycobacterium sp.]|uniref:hypothetical protein n=1 Tax=Mycobacterium sp. TaxID=1785 RepID=UPI002D854FBC|nr:hypothetical protein [Mycobacterium sp.]
MSTKTDDLTAKPPLVEEAVLDDLRRRLHATNRVRLPEGTGWERGTAGTSPPGSNRKALSPDCAPR